MDARKLKFAVVGAMALASIATLAFVSLKGNMVYAITVSEFHEDTEKYRELGLRVEGALTPGSHTIEQTKAGAEHSFTMQDKEDASLRLQVRFIGPVPDTMREEGDLMVEGRLGEDGVLVASKVTPKCASKYDATVDEAFQNSKSSQGYNATSFTP